MPAAVLRTIAPTATANMDITARYSAPPTIIRRTCGSPSEAVCVDGKIAWAMKKAAKSATSETTKDTMAMTSILASSAGMRVGAALRVERIIPVLYSEPIEMTPSTTMTSWPKLMPKVATDAPSGRSLPKSEMSCERRAKDMRAAKPRTMNTITASDQMVERTVVSLMISLLTRRGNVTL